MRGLLRRDIKRAAKQLGVDLGAVLGKSGGEYEESLKALELGDLSVYPPAEQLKRARDHFVDVVAEVETGGAREGLNNPHLGRNAIGCGSKIRFEDLSER